MTIPYLTCGKCLQPIEEGETGLRHFGSYAAHPEDRCIYLLSRKLIEREPAIQRLEQSRQELLLAIQALLDAHAANTLFSGAGHWEQARAAIAKATS